MYWWPYSLGKNMWKKSEYGKMDFNKCVAAALATATYSKPCTLSDVLLMYSWCPTHSGGNSHGSSLLVSKLSHYSLLE